MGQRREPRNHFTWSNAGPFRIDESQLRRIADFCSSQTKPETLDEEQEISFYVRTKDGTEMVLADLESVFEMENEGRYAIRGLRMVYETLPVIEEGADEKARALKRIAVGFDADVEERRSRPSFESFVFVIGVSRDWALRTHDELKERVERTSAYSRFVRSLFDADLGLAAFPILLMVMPVGTWLLLRSVDRNVQSAAKSLDALPADASIASVTKVLMSQQLATPSVSFFVVLAVALVIPCVFIFSRGKRLLTLIYPPYVFYWAGAIARTDRLEAIRGKVYWGILIGFLVSFLAGLVIVPLA